MEPHNYAFTAKKNINALSEQNRKQFFLSFSSKLSVRAQVLCIFRRRDVSIGVGLEDGGEILLVIGVVYAVLRLVFLKAVHRAVGGVREDGRGRELVQVLGTNVSVFEAVQVLGFCAVRWDGGEGAAG